MVSKALHVLPAAAADAHSSAPSERRWKGVRKRSWGRYVCEIRLPRSRERIWLGSYATAEEAACAYDAASLCLRGTSASLNFPSSIVSPLLLKDTAPNQLPHSREEIQSIAAAAAARCRNLQQLSAGAEKLPLSFKVLSDLDRPLKCAKSHRIEAQQGSPALSGRSQMEETSHWACRTDLQVKAEEDMGQAEEAYERRVQESSATAEQQSRGAEEGRRAVGSTGAEEDPCVFSVLKELVALPMLMEPLYANPKFQEVHDICHVASTRSSLLSHV